MAVRKKTTIQNSLFGSTVAAPLAEQLRPKTLDEVMGQEHLTGPDGVLRRMVESKKLQ